MPLIEPLCALLGIKFSALSAEENGLLEIELFSHIYEELKFYFSEQYRHYFRLLHFTKEKENLMLENKFIRLIINDILLSDEYNVAGIAYYTDTYVDVIEEILAGRHTNPSAVFVRKLIELHRSVRRELYEGIINKVREMMFGDKK